MNNSTVVMALSGGVDSTTLLTWLLEKGYNVICATFDYGSKHNDYELDCAIATYHRYKRYYSNLLGIKSIELFSIFEHFNSSLLEKGGAIPEGHYTDETMKQTVVPARNIIFLSIMAGLAGSHDASMIGIGIHQGDHAIYADCRADFYEAMDRAITLGTDNGVQIAAPFVNMTKAEVIELGLELNVPYSMTRTCYKQQKEACGKCGACVERLESFHANNATDPISYE